MTDHLERFTCSLNWCHKELMQFLCRICHNSDSFKLITPTHTEAQTVYIYVEGITDHISTSTSEALTTTTTMTSYHQATTITIVLVVMMGASNGYNTKVSATLLNLRGYVIVGGACIKIGPVLSYDSSGLRTTTCGLFQKFPASSQFLQGTNQEITNTPRSLCMAYLRTKWFRRTEERWWVQAPTTNINFRFSQGRIFHQNVNISVEANPRRALKLPCIPISVALFNIPGIRTTLLMLLPNFMGFTHFH